jgi:hypothetical protein
VIGETSVLEEEIELFDLLDSWVFCRFFICSFFCRLGQSTLTFASFSVTRSDDPQV